MVRMMAVLAHRVGLAWTPSTIFFMKPSSRLSLEDAGCPSSHPSGFTNETAGEDPTAVRPVGGGGDSRGDTPRRGPLVFVPLERRVHRVQEAFAALAQVTMC